MDINLILEIILLILGILGGTTAYTVSNKKTKRQNKDNSILLEQISILETEINLLKQEINKLKQELHEKNKIIKALVEKNDN